jgi:eukaryotic-like serine/threonine-protein kinase
MPDWRLLTESIGHAATLDHVSAQELINRTFHDPVTLELARRLLPRVSAREQFMRTSALGDGPDLNNHDMIGLKTGDRIGVWQIEEIIGRGGMGEVYRAHRSDGLYEQTVALKLILGLEPSRARRFWDERKRLARMDHPGIARILDGGETPDGRAFMVMEFVDGQSIDTYARSKGLGRDEKLRLFTLLCQAVGHAHGRLVLHRDIKPDNVLVDDQGLVRLIDFGIASDVDDENSAGMALTLASAAPEQLKAEAVSIQTDIFALGVLLHQLLVGAPPQRRADAGMSVSVDANADADVSAILQRCLELDPQRRYASADALKADIQAVLTNLPVIARDGGALYRSKKFIMRYPVASGMAAALALALAGGLGVSLKYARDSQREFERANAALNQANENLKRSEYALGRADMFYATQSAYSDALQYLFSGDGNVGRHTEILLGRWRQAYDKRKDDPEHAAYLSFAIGRQFVFRNDYVTAIQILEPLVQEKFGPADLAKYAAQTLAIAYMSSGKKQEALPYLREFEAWMSRGYLAGSPDHISAASQIANITEALPDIQVAEKLLLAGLNDKPVPAIRRFFWTQLAQLRQKRGDLASAYEAAKNAVSVASSTPLIEVAGSDTVMVNLAEYELWHSADLKRAEELANSALQTGQQKKGESREQGRAQAILALAQAERGEFKRALEQIDRGIEVIERFGGVASDASITASIQRAEILSAIDGREASRALIALRPRVESRAPGDTIATRLKLAEVYVAARLDGPEAGRRLYSDLKIERKSVQRNLQLFAMHKRLEKMGIAKLQ